MAYLCDMITDHISTSRQYQKWQINLACKWLITPHEQGGVVQL